jgi:GH15 family glucan-1,4-alpha-glucosidase
MYGTDPYQPIENYGIVGDLHTVALVGRNGSIDFMCFPDFDSPSIFAALLDHKRGGRFQLRPCLDGCRERQMYLPDTNVLITRFLARDGVAEVSDFMPVSPGDCPAHTLVRRAKVVRGTLDFEMTCDPRFDYGRSSHRVDLGDGEVRFIPEPGAGPALRLRTAVPVRVDRTGAVHATFTHHAGEKAAFVLERLTPGEDSEAAAPSFVADSFRLTSNYWRNWVGRSHYTGRWREIVTRSALVLKLLVSQRHGSIIAAATFGLPEELGGTRNWDYRYTWIRDASFTLYALIRLGYTEEAGAFMRWIEDRCADLNPDGSLQIMYGHDGRKVLTETTLTHFEGYRRSRPVRIGNGAYEQLQLDIYGELMDAVYLYNKYGEAISFELWHNCVRLVDYVCANWYLPDEGIWEVRGGRQEFLYSRLMCWVALDRGIRLARRRSLPAPLERWLRTRDAICADILTNFWDPARRTFVQCKGSDALDAACLLMPLIKFISPTDPQWLSTLAAIQHTLVDDSLVFRYRVGHGADDGLPGGEGTFTMCSFWYAEALARSGDVQKARYIFDKIIGYANHVGLFAEELGPHGEHLGNYPQAFTHLGLISAAWAIDRKLTDAGWLG